jgi:hypothetical protein
MNKEIFIHEAQNLLFRFLDRALTNLIYLDSETAFYPGGQNGPHFALETPVRNTCHWMMAFAIGYSIRPELRYLEVTRALYRWLVKKCLFKKKNYYVFRQVGPDWSNGVIGNAWIIESFVRVACHLKINQAYEVANSLYQTNHFNSRVGAWHRHDPINKKYTIDYTLDHQAWFACAASDLGKNDEVNSFLMACQDGAFRVRPNGRIAHLYYSSDIGGRMRRIIFRYRELRMPEFIEEIEIGYHHYTLLPFARLYRCYRSHSFFKTIEFKKAISHIGLDWLKAVEASRYGYQYNAPGFELPLIINAFESELDLNWADMHKVLEKQMKITGNKELNFCAENNPDPLTLSARIYELGLFLESVR